MKPVHPTIRHLALLAAAVLVVVGLLAPVGAGALSQTVSQQEYSKLFEQDRLGIVNATTYATHGQWIQNAAQFGMIQSLQLLNQCAHMSGVRLLRGELCFEKSNRWDVTGPRH